MASQSVTRSELGSGWTFEWTLSKNIYTSNRQDEERDRTNSILSSYDDLSC